MNEENQVFGGTPMTTKMLLKAMENSGLKIEAKQRSDFSNAKEIKEFLSGGDISHVDDMFTLEVMFNAGMEPPNVIGPIARSPIKDYKDGKMPDYTPDWFYKSRVIRLNDAEEKDSPFLKEIIYITHGVDTERLKVANKIKKYVLWAGNKERYAKNYEMWEEIKKMQLPEGFEFKELTHYDVQDYWTILEETAILVNTSRYESFCCALFEARAKGVATIQKKGLNSDRWKDAKLQIDYEVKAYQKAILFLLENGKFFEYGIKNRKYVEEKCSLEKMKESYEKAYRVVKKNG